MTTVCAPMAGRRRKSHGVRYAYSSPDVSANIGFSALSATVSSAANRRLHGRTLNAEQDDAARRMVEYFRSLSREVTGEARRQAPSRSQRERRYALLRVAKRENVTNSERRTPDASIELAAFLGRLADATETVRSWEEPDEAAAQFVKAALGAISGSMLTAVPMSGESRTLLG